MDHPPAGDELHDFAPVSSHARRSVLSPAKSGTLVTDIITGRELPAIVHGGPLGEEEGLGTLTLPGFLKEVTQRFGAREALVMHSAAGVERWTYDDLWNRSMEVARALVAMGVSKDSRVGILRTNRPEFLSSVFGTALSGGVAVMLNTFSTAVELEYMMQLSSISVLLYEGRVVKKDFTALLNELEPAIPASLPGALKSL